MSDSGDRVRAYRDRKRRGGKLMTVECPKGYELALVEAGFLKEWDTENEFAIARAIERVMQELVRRY
jgi:hypothetical protein